MDYQHTLFYFHFTCTRSFLPRLIFSINSLNYHKTKLDIKLIVEEDDFLTLKELHCSDHFHVVIVSKYYSFTKPEAINYALKFARDKYIIVYDAEDRSEPNKLRKIVHTFPNSSNDIICVQAKFL
ncbi:MAG: glycosyltransferase [Rickettsiales endosymbiont of Dermacentor nuttalli]